MDKEKMQEAADTKDFKKMNLIQKHKEIEKILDNDIRPMLANDGGSLEVLDIKEEDGKVIVYIRYLGACMGCPSATTGTLSAIQNYLYQKLDDSIVVMPV